MQFIVLISYWFVRSSSIVAWPIRMSVLRILPRALYVFGCHAATQTRARSAWIHDNAIHDLALAYWSVLLSPIKRAALLPTGNRLGKYFATFAVKLGRSIYYMLRNDTAFDLKLFLQQ